LAIGRVDGRTRAVDSLLRIREAWSIPLTAGKDRLFITKGKSNEKEYLFAY
jgi:hypothetical protein